MVAELFLGALPPFASRQVRHIRLFGPQARGFEPEVPFDLLVEVDKRSIEVKTAVAIASSAVESEGLASVFVTLVTPFERAQASGSLARTLRNAEREGLDLWLRPEEVDEHLH